MNELRGYIIDELEKIEEFVDANGSSPFMDGRLEAFEELLAQIDELTEGELDTLVLPEMCPNCITPWKCAGPHEPDQDEESN